MASRLATTSRCMVQCARVTRCRCYTQPVQRLRHTLVPTSRGISSANAARPPINAVAQQSGGPARLSDQRRPDTLPPTAPLLSPAESDERVRQILLDRDGGPASVPTREGKWDSEMGRDTARQMFRVLDQTREAKPGQQHAAGEGASKYWNRRNY